MESVTRDRSSLVVQYAFHQAGEVQEALAYMFCSIYIQGPGCLGSGHKLLVGQAEAEMHVPWLRAMVKVKRAECRFVCPVFGGNCIWAQAYGSMGLVEREREGERGRVGDHADGWGRLPWQQFSVATKTNHATPPPPRRSPHWLS